MVTFQSIRSGSDGNLLLLEIQHGDEKPPEKILIDFGLQTQRQCRQVLESEVGLDPLPVALLVTHAHSDHINYSSLRVVGDLRIPLYVHGETHREIEERYLNPFRVPPTVDVSSLDFRLFDKRPFSVGSARVLPIRLPHAPETTTHGFLIEAAGLRILLAADFNDPEAVLPHIYDCDLIYIEANHDPELLERFFNPASFYHLSNPAAGLLLQHTLLRSRRLPQAVVLGHLSAERNSPSLALRTVLDILDESGLRNATTLLASPRHQASQAVALADRTSRMSRR